MAWPRELGGWGFPGSQKAPPLWRKATASILISASANEYMKEYRNIHVVEGLKQNVRTRVLKGIEYIEKFCPPSDPEDTGRTRIELEKNIVESVTSSFRLAKGNFVPEPQAYKLARVSKRIKRKVNEFANKWKSAKPINQSKAIRLMA